MLDEMFALSLPEMRRGAAYWKQTDQNLSLHVTAPVNETYMSFVRHPPTLRHLYLFAG